VVLAERSWRRVTWRHGTKGALTARFAAVRIRVGDGATFANNLDFPPRSGGLRSERHAAMPMLTLAISSRACAGVR
jgi:hypothetical protein